MTERGGASNESTDLVKQDGRSLPTVAQNGEIALSTEFSVEHAGKKFKVAAYGLSAAGALVVAAMIAIQAWIPTAQPMMWMLGVIAGGLLATATMHGRLADNRAELARVRGELDRKSLECSRLVARIVRNPQSSRRKKSKEEQR